MLDYTFKLNEQVVLQEGYNNCPHCNCDRAFLRQATLKTEGKIKKFSTSMPNVITAHVLWEGVAGCNGLEGTTSGQWICRNHLRPAEPAMQRLFSTAPYQKYFRLLNQKVTETTPNVAKSN